MNLEYQGTIKIEMIQLNDAFYVPVSCIGKGCNYEHKYLRKSKKLLVCSLPEKYEWKIIYDRLFRRLNPGEKVKVSQKEVFECPKCGTNTWILEMNRKQAEKLESAFSDALKYDYDKMYTDDEFQVREQERIEDNRKPKFLYLDFELTESASYTVLLNEINDCFDGDAFSATIVLVRKIIENLIVDILRAMYGLSQIDLYYIKSQHRFQNLSELIKNLRERVEDFEPYGFHKRHVGVIEKLREEANANAHSVIDHANRQDLLNLRDNAKKAILSLYKTLENIIAAK